MLHLLDTNFFHLKSGLGEVNNNYVEIMALKILLLAAIEKHCKTLYIFGDSMLIISWTKGVRRCHNMTLLSLLDKVLLLKQHFYYFSVNHVYREHNQDSNGLSKE